MAQDTASTPLITPVRYRSALGSVMRVNLDGRPIIEPTSLDDFDR